MRDQEEDVLEELLRYMEQVLGACLRTREDVDRYLAFLAEVNPRRERSASFAYGWQAGKRLVLIALTAFAVFQYFAVDVVTEVLSTDRIKFLTPPPASHTART